MTFTFIQLLQIFEAEVIDDDGQFPANFTKYVSKLIIDWNEMDTFNQLCLILNVIINFRYINHEIEKHLQEHAEAQKLRDSPDLLFRPFLRWLDRNLENLFTKALKQVNLPF